MNPTSIYAETKLIREDKHLMKIVIPFKILGDECVDWRWFNIFHEGVKKYNEDPDVKKKRKCPAYFLCTSGKIDIGFPNDLPISPELVLEQEKIAHKLAADTDEIFKIMQQKIEEERKNKDNARQTAINVIRDMKR